MIGLTIEPVARYALGSLLDHIIGDHGEVTFERMSEPLGIDEGHEHGCEVGHTSGMELVGRLYGVFHA
jgi:hypothetical protein